MNHVHALRSARTGKEKGRQGGADGWSHGRRKQGGARRGQPSAQEDTAGNRVLPGVSSPQQDRGLSRPSAA